LPPRPCGPNAGNARIHSKKQIKQIARSIERFGFTNPILVSHDRGVIAGHGRLRAAQQLGMTSVPIVVLATMSEAERRAYVLADNKLAENAGWDPDILAQLNYRVYWIWSSMIQNSQDFRSAKSTTSLAMPPRKAPPSLDRRMLFRLRKSRGIAPWRPAGKQDGQSS
jgi:hypothetical protein